MATDARPSVRRGDAVAFGMAALVMGVVFAGVTAWVVADPDGVTPVDESIDAAVHEVAVANPWLVDVSLALQWLGSVPVTAVVVTVVVVALLLAGGLARPWGARAYAAAFLALSAAGAAVLNTVVKHLVERPRPPWNGLWSYEESLSYPSGHAQAGISAWVAMGLVALVVLRGRWRWVVALPLLVVGPVIGMSRTVLGVHWPTDVLGGWTLGAAWMSLSAFLVILVASRTPPQVPAIGPPPTPAEDGSPAA
ncbi:MAG: phosphatase PAP2 family protein [Candidatus Nanopelagicales bacterium]